LFFLNFLKLLKINKLNLNAYGHSNKPIFPYIDPKPEVDLTSNIFISQQEAFLDSNFMSPTFNLSNTQKEYTKSPSKAFKNSSCSTSNLALHFTSAKPPKVATEEKSLSSISDTSFAGSMIEEDLSQDLKNIIQAKWIQKLLK
jgi:hypothetical protein